MVATSSSSSTRTLKASRWPRGSAPSASASRPYASRPSCVRVLEELDVGTTARAMGCSEGAVKTHLSRARDALKKQLDAWQ